MEEQQDPKTQAALQEANRAMNKVGKWRQVFAGWQLGTRSDKDPECRAIRDQRDSIICLRIETSALASLALKKKLFTLEEWAIALKEEAEFLDKAYEEKFPGMRSSDIGMVYFDMDKVKETMKDWKP